MDNNNFNNNGYTNPYANAAETQKGTMNPETGTYSYSRATDPNAQQTTQQSAPYTQQNANPYQSAYSYNGQTYSYGAGQTTTGQTTTGQTAAGQAGPTPVKPAKAKKAKKKGGWGSFISKAAVAALIFGLVGGGIFTGVSYLGTRSLKTNKTTTSASASDSNDDTTTSTDNSDLKDGVVEAVSTADLTVTDVSDAVAAVMPSIVAITNYSTTTYQSMFGQSQTEESESCGSGIIVGQDDDYLYIATNNHVVSGAEKLTVQFSDDTVVNAEVKGTYEAKDLAVVQVTISDIESDTLDTIKIAEIGDSTSLQVGESAIAIGNALGYGQSVTTGVISALGREVTVSDETTGVSITNDNLIQTDAAINPGNSGGALINASGQVIGINSAKYSDTSVEGFGFAIPMEDAWPIINQIITKTAVDSADAAYLGIRGQDVSASVASAYGIPEGVYVYEIVSGSAAEEAGLQSGDIITALGDQTVYSMDGLSEALTYYAAGDTVDLTVYRADNSNQYQEVTITVTLGSASGVSH